MDNDDLMAYITSTYRISNVQKLMDALDKVCSDPKKMNVKFVRSILLDNIDTDYDVSYIFSYLTQKKCNMVQRQDNRSSTGLASVGGNYSKLCKSDVRKELESIIKSQLTKKEMIEIIRQYKK